MRLFYKVNIDFVTFFRPFLDFILLTLAHCVTIYNCLQFYCFARSASSFSLFPSPLSVLTEAPISKE